MGWEAKYNDSEIVGNHTKGLSKIWDNLMPETYPYVLKFTTNSAVEVHKIKKMGPYHMSEKFIDYDCHVLVDRTPLDEIGWDGKSEVSREMTDEAYGERYFHDMRMTMVELSKYAGLGITSSFDFGGQLHATVKD